MIGAIIGDIVGSRFEFNNTHDYNLQMFHKKCSYTDDTICTVAIADAILQGKSYRDSLLYWCRKYPAPMGAYGGSFGQWIHSDNPQPYYSYGNGAAMRVSPVAWAYDDYHKMSDEAIMTALPTHNHPEGLQGALSVACTIWCCRFKASDKEIENMGNLYYPGFMVKNYPKGTFDETCMGTVPLAFKILLESSSFEDAIRKAVSHGGDSDTLGAIVGSMAESKFGIPRDIRDKALTYLPYEMLDVIEKFKDKFGYNG